MEGIVEFEVTQDMIYDGQRFDGDVCPIALAIRAKLNRDDIDVGVTHIEIGERSGVLLSYLMPAEAVKFVDQFDEGGADAVQPFKFSLDFSEGKNVNE